jgi:predicted transcriptional regulator
MSFSTAYLTIRETSIWDLRRKSNSQSEIGRLLGISRQAAHKSLSQIDEKVEQAFREAAKTNNLEIKSINLVEGIMESYSPIHKLPVFVSFSRVNGLRVWYMHEGNCGSCGYEAECRSYLEKEAEERIITLSGAEKELPPTQLALKFFNKVMGVEKDG